MNKELINKIREKREFSQLPEADIEMAYRNFEKRQVSEEDKIRLTKEFLRKVFSVFLSKKLLSLKNKDEEWILRKHASTRERLAYYMEIYRRILNGLNDKISIIDLGAGINGFSYKFFEESGFNVNYIAVEAIGQLVELVNDYFRKNEINGKTVHLSLFELDKVKGIIKGQKKPRIVLLFKTLDSLEMLERDYSVKLLSEISPFADRIVVSFATRSLGSRERFRTKREWIVNFIKDNFKILDDFEIAGERYIVFERRK